MKTVKSLAVVFMVSPLMFSEIRNIAYLNKLARNLSSFLKSSVGVLCLSLSAVFYLALPDLDQDLTHALCIIFMLFRGNSN